MNHLINILKDHHIEVIESLSQDNKITVVSEYMRGKEKYVKIEKIKATYKDIRNYLGY